MDNATPGTRRQVESERVSLPVCDLTPDAPAIRGGVEYAIGEQPAMDGVAERQALGRGEALRQLLRRESDLIEGPAAVCAANDALQREHPMSCDITRSTCPPICAGDPGSVCFASKTLA